MTCTAVSECPYRVPGLLGGAPGLAEDVPPQPRSPVDQTIAQVACATLGKDVHSDESGVKGVKREAPEEAAGECERKKRKEAPSSEDVEVTFVENRKKIMGQRLAEWRKNYDPQPAGAFWWTPGAWAPMCKIVHDESFEVLDTFVAKIATATTRQKIASLLLKNKASIQASMFCMNADTAKKMTEACTIIDEELKELGNCAKTTTKVSEKAPRTISATDPLHAEKTRLLHQLNDWKVTFDPQPLCFLSWVGGFADYVKKKFTILFDDLCKGIAHAKTPKELCEFLERRKQLIIDYRTFVDAATATQVDAACEILSKEQQGLKEKG